MYCGKNRTALASQEQIAKAVLRLMEKKPYDSISICELCKEACVSRQTFYSLFESKDNVMVFILQERYLYEPIQEDTEPSCIAQLCRTYAHYIVGQKDFIRTLEENNITYLLHDSFRSVLSECPCFLENLSAKVRPYAINFIAGAFTSIAQVYVQDDEAVDESLLYQISLDLLVGHPFT